MDHNFTKHLLKKTTYGHFNTSYWDRLSVAQDGTLFVSDHLHHTIKRVTRCGLVETYAGMSDDWGWRDGDCREALFKFPFVVLCDSRGVVYVGEEATVRKITPDGVVTTIAGGSEVGLSDGPLGESMVNGVISMAMDRHEQSLFFVDYWNNRIRCIDLKSYVVSSLKNGDSYDFYDTTAVAVSRDGKDIYIARTYHEYSLVVLKDYRNNNQLTRFPVQSTFDYQTNPKKANFSFFQTEQCPWTILKSLPHSVTFNDVCDGYDGWLWIIMDAFWVHVGFDVKPGGNIVSVTHEISEFILSSESLLDWPHYHLNLPCPLQIQVETFLLLIQQRIPRDVVRIIVINIIAWFIRNVLKDVKIKESGML